MHVDKDDSVSANQEVFAWTNLIWVEGTFDAFYRKVNHGIYLNFSMCFFDFFPTRSQILHAVQRIVVRW